MIALAFLCAFAWAMGLSGVSARAAITHHYLSQITEVPSGSGAPLPGKLLGPSGLAVDGGELYVADGTQDRYRLDKFDASSDAFVSQFVQVSSLSYLHQGVAVGHATGETEVYTAGDQSGTQVGTVAVFDAGGLQAEWKGTATPAGAFGCFQCAGTGDVAVDNSSSIGDWASGDVYVADPDNGVVDVFKPEAGGKEPPELVAQLTGVSPSEPFSLPYQVAVSAVNGDVLVSDHIGNAYVVDIFTPAALPGQYEFAGELTGTPNGSFGNVSDVAVDGSDGDIYIADYEIGLDEFSPAGVFLGQITGVGTPVGSFERVSSVAVDPATGNVYVGDINPRREENAVNVFGGNLTIPDVTTGPASAVKPMSATLDGTVNPNGLPIGECEFVWGESPALGRTVSCSESPGEIGSGVAPVEVHAGIAGLQPDTTYYYRLRASNENGTNSGEASQDHEFTTPGPGIRSESTSDVAAASATLEASIDPHGTPTSYYFQYGTSIGYGSEVPSPPGAGLGSSEGDVEVSQHLQNLTAGTVYHYRVVAVSEPAPGVFEAFGGPDRTFTTQSVGGGLGLPDSRAWEMVSPPDKLGTQIFAIGQYADSGAVIQAAAGGGALTYVTTSPTEADPQGYNNRQQVFSTRGATGWGSRDITIPHDTATSVSIGAGLEYRFFSEDLSLGLIQPFGEFMPSLSGEASEQTPYVRTDFVGSDANSPCVSSCYRPLVTGMAGHANVPAGTAFGEEGQCPPKIYCGPEFVGATPDLKHVILGSPVSLTSTPTPTNGIPSLYEWSGGELALVSTLPDGTASHGVVDLELGGNESARRAISDDGSRVVWYEPSTGHIYLRYNATQRQSAVNGSGECTEPARACTLQLDAVQGGSGKGNNGPLFQIASFDGSRVFFTDSQYLTGNSRELGLTDLYECNVVEGAGGLRCNLSDLTPSGSVEPMNAEGVVGASEDGSWVYFVAGTTMYVRHDGTTKVVAVLASADRPDWESGNLTGMTARVSSDGRWLAFMSQRELTGYDPRDAVSGKPDEEVYLYDAEANGGTGKVVCASCNPTGARPVGIELTSKSLADSVGTWSGSSQGIAANVPGWTPYRLARSRYQSRYLAGDGRLFFNSNDALVPQDVNGTEDVYEYEPPGAGDCSVSSVSFSLRSDGCVGLVSSGGSAEESVFMDASATGGDVFFLTAARLSGVDRDTALDIYDAHECTTGSPCFAVPPVQPPVCDTGDSCKAAPSLQPAVFGAPSSATFSGAGNVASRGAKPIVRSRGLTRAQKLIRALKECRKRKNEKRRAVCVHRAKARYARSGSLRVNASRRSGR